MIFVSCFIIFLSYINILFSEISASHHKTVSSATAEIFLCLVDTCGLGVHMGERHIMGLWEIVLEWKIIPEKINIFLTKKELIFYFFYFFWAHLLDKIVIKISKTTQLLVSAGTKLLPQLFHLHFFFLRYVKAESQIFCHFILIYFSITMRLLSHF